MPSKYGTMDVMDDNNSEISKDPDIVSGVAVFRGTRVPIGNLFDYLEAGDSIDEFIDGFPSVSKDQVVKVLKELQELADEAA